MNLDKKYLITGGAGFLGKALISRLINKGFHRLVVVSRNEERLIQLKDKFKDVEIIAGDITDPFICEKACHDVDGIFHLAAFKHVRMAEIDTYRCVQTNVIGTMNLLNMAIKYEHEIFVFISTDKAAQINGIYGATKYISEKMVQEHSKINLKTTYRNIRYGNVWNSTGSFITRWRPLMERGEEIFVTEPKATRFFFTVDHAVDLIFKSIEEGKDAAPFIPEMKGISMATIIEACKEHYGEFPIKITGLQKGENLHETLDGKVFSNQVEQYTKDEFIREFLCHMK